MALDTIGEAIQKGKSYGLIPGGPDWDVPREYQIPGYAPSLEILEGDDTYLGTRMTWLIAVLLWDRLYDIVEEFRCYCGENGVDPNCEGKCMDEFPPTPGEGTNKPENSGTLKQDYYTLFNYMRELERAGIPVNEYMRSPLFPNIIKLVDDGTTDYNVEHLKIGTIREHKLSLKWTHPTV